MNEDSSTKEGTIITRVKVMTSYCHFVNIITFQKLTFELKSFLLLLLLNMIIIKYSYNLYT